jgi:hypothetical protein
MGFRFQFSSVSCSSSQPSMMPSRMRRSTRSSSVRLVVSIFAERKAALLLELRDFGGDGSRREIVEQVVVAVDAVPGGDRRMAAREVVEIVVDEPGECLGRARCGPARHEDDEAGGDGRDDGQNSDAVGAHDTDGGGETRLYLVQPTGPTLSRKSYDQPDDRCQSPRCVRPLHPIDAFGAD